MLQICGKNLYPNGFSLGMLVLIAAYFIHIALPGNNTAFIGLWVARLGAFILLTTFITFVFDGFIIFYKCKKSRQPNKKDGESSDPQV